MEKQVRLDKFLTEMGIGSRSQVKDYIKKGRVQLDGSRVSRSDIKVAPESSQVSVDGKTVTYVSFEYYMLYKPKGVLSATTDSRETTVLDLIGDKKRKDLFPVGRLDKDTEGLLLITNDGDMAHRLLSPRHHVPKVYYAEIDGAVTEETVALFQKGLLVEEDFRAMPAELILLPLGEGKYSRVELTVYEGKFHQVKRMFSAVGCQVVYLKRLSMGSLVLDERLGKGGYRHLTEEELLSLRKELK